MTIVWLLLAAVVLFYVLPRMVRGGAEDENRVRTGQRDLGANVSPSQLGNEVDLWPDRTGARTRRELGARHATDVTFVGDRIEHKEGTQALAAAQTLAAGTQGEAQADVNAVGKHGPGTNTAADLAPEDEFGEDRPAHRTTAPDAQPTQWHPKDHGVPGDHIRDGHHRSATAPERHSDATDPYAHAPIPGPNHIPPEGGVEFPPDVRP
ncbi:MAG TPA: hypothetical protein VK464_15110 [Symbiobacteriaceae bacterium]|nr:hypothetical protein [Symbiobacteriaceae bacterium]